MMMEKAKEMILADALDCAIRAERENIILKRVIVGLTFLCGVLGGLLWTVI